MATGSEVLKMLLPDGGYAICGDDFDNILFLEAKPITKKQFEDGFDKYDAWKLKQDNSLIAAKTALLEKLGITADEAKLLLG